MNSQLYISFITAMLAAIVAWTAYQQHRLAKERLKLDLFEKRFAVYKATQRFLTVIMSRPATCEDSDLFEYRGGIQDGTFLFGPNIPDYTDILYKKTVEMQSLHMQCEGEPVGEKRSALVSEQFRLLKELT